MTTRSASLSWVRTSSMTSTSPPTSAMCVTSETSRSRPATWRQESVLLDRQRDVGRGSQADPEWVDQDRETPDDAGELEPLNSLGEVRIQPGCIA